MSALTPPQRQRSASGQAPATFSSVLSGLIDHAVEQLEACTDDPCRRAWRRVLDELEMMMPDGVAEADQ